jgi:catecholate siderophore receptor
MMTTLRSDDARASSCPRIGYERGPGAYRTEISMGKKYSMTARLCAVALWATGAVSAQEPNSGDDEPKTTAPGQPAAEVEEYVFVEGSLPYVPNSNTIVTRLPLELRLTPNNVGIVTAPLISEQFDRIASDALVNVSNVNIQTQNGVQDFFYIRGFDSLSSGLVLTDGAAEPEATYYQLYNVERVEVLKGPGGFLYGPNPLAGAMNLVRKQPAPGSFFDFHAAAGSFDNYEGSFDWNAGSADSPIAFRLNGLYRDQGSYRPGKGGRTGGINPALSWQLDDSSNLNVNFEYMSADLTPDSGIPVLRDTIAPVDLDNDYQSPLDDSEQDVFRFQADYQKVISSAVTIRNKFYRRDLDWVSTGTIFNGAIPTGPESTGVIRTLLDLDDRQDITGNRFEAVFSFDTGASVGHSFLTGLELARYGDVFTLDVNLLQIVDLNDPVEPPGSMPVPLPGAGFAGDSRSVVIAPYFIDQIQFGEYVNVLLGGRIDNIDFDDQANARSRNDTEFSPMVGVLVAPDDEISIYGNFSRSFAPPSPRVTGELVPERGTQIEAGVKKRFGALNAETSFAVYQLERDNIPIPDDTGFTQQTGTQRSRGFEVDFAAQPSSRARAFASYAFNDAELTEFAELVQVSLSPPAFVTFDHSGNDPAFAPKHIFNFWLSHDFASHWGIGGGGRYVSDQFIAEDNALSLDGVLTFDAMVFYEIGVTRLRLNVKNLTDREYFLRGFGGVSVIPAPPISAFFSVDVRM